MKSLLGVWITNDLKKCKFQTTTTMTPFFMIFYYFKLVWSPWIAQSFAIFFWNYYLISEYYGSTNCTMRRLPERITFPSSVDVVSFHISQFLLLFPKAFWELHGVFPVIMRLWLKIPLNLFHFATQLK